MPYSLYIGELQSVAVLSEVERDMWVRSNYPGLSSMSFTDLIEYDLGYLSEKALIANRMDASDADLLTHQIVELQEILSLCMNDHKSADRV